MSVADYTVLIPHQHSTKPKFLDWMQVNLQPFADIQELCLNMHLAFDLDLAVGIQLDIIGQIVGASRLLPFQPTGGLNPLLGDEDYRFLSKARILKNHWKGTNQEIYDAWAVLFSDVFISLKDNQDMTVTAIVIGDLNELRKQMVYNGLIIPKAQGVYMTYAFPTPPIYSYDQNTSYFKGRDEASWLETI